MYVINIVWSMILAASAGLWAAALAPIVVCLVPAVFALRGQRSDRAMASASRTVSPTPSPR